MGVKQQELLSAFVDGELNAGELEQLIALLDSDEAARTELIRYQYQSDVIHGYGSGKPLVDLSKNISIMLQNEKPLIADISTQKKAALIRVPDWLWRQTAGLAVAASLGAFAVLSVINTSPSPSQSTVVAEVSPSSESNMNRWTVGEAEVEDRLNDYLVDHNEYAGASGMFSYARVVSYGEE